MSQPTNNERTPHEVTLLDEHGESVSRPGSMVFWDEERATRHGEEVLASMKRARAAGWSLKTRAVMITPRPCWPLVR